MYTDSSQAGVVTIRGTYVKGWQFEYYSKIELPDVYDYYVGFYPEGGYLLAGIEQVVAFKAEATTGISPCIKGYVMNLAGDTLVSFQSEHEGIGSFALTAETGDSLLRLHTMNRE